MCSYKLKPDGNLLVLIIACVVIVLGRWATISKTNPVKICPPGGTSTWWQKGRSTIFEFPLSNIADDPKQIVLCHPDFALAFCWGTDHADLILKRTRTSLISLVFKLTQFMAKKEKLSWFKQKRDREVDLVDLERKQASGGGDRAIWRTSEGAISISSPYVW